ncbi:hypothetical protein AB0E55_22820 [Amycolatopsis keratiniphila]|uniref:hypothetical protein n=1 Tax=Amycolatopsis keratiniphila TaxID=129921 RepID=UPI0033E8EF63
MTFDDSAQQIAWLSARVGDLERRVADHDRLHRQHRGDIDDLYELQPPSPQVRSTAPTTEWTKPPFPSGSYLRCPWCWHCAPVVEVFYRQMAEGRAPACPECSHLVDTSTLVRLRQRFKKYDERMRALRQQHDDDGAAGGRGSDG